MPRRLGFRARRTPPPRPCVQTFGLLRVRVGLVQLPCPAQQENKTFVEFLNDEIKEEKKIQSIKSLPKMSGGWELEVNGTEAKLLRKVAREKITATFNIHNSMLPTFDGEEEPRR